MAIKDLRQDIIIDISHEDYNAWAYEDNKGLDIHVSVENAPHINFSIPWVVVRKALSNRDK